MKEFFFSFISIPDKDTFENVNFISVFASLVLSSFNV